MGMYYVFMGPPPPHINVEVLLNIMIDNNYGVITIMLEIPWRVT